MLLFSDPFPLARTDKELELLFDLYPMFDKGYVCAGASTTHQRTKKWLEELWGQYEPYADTHFSSEFKRQFSQRCWELYLGSVLLNRRFKLEKPQRSGPDFKIRDQRTGGAVWIEAIAVNKGDSNDRVPDIVYNQVVNVPTREILLRIASGIRTKHEVYTGKYLGRAIKETEPFVIALNKGELEYGDAFMPNILKVVFGIGDPVVRMRVNGRAVKKPTQSWSQRYAIHNHNDQPVSMLFFENELYSGISAVIYSHLRATDCPRHPSQMGESFVIVHNPLAKNPLPVGFFPFGDEYSVTGAHIQKVRSAPEFERPNPFF